MGNLKPVLIQIPESLLKQVDRLVKKLGYPDRSEYIREAIRRKVQEDLKLLQNGVSG